MLSKAYPWIAEKINKERKRNPWGTDRGLINEQAWILSEFFFLESSEKRSEVDFICDYVSTRSRRIEHGTKRSTRNAKNGREKKNRYLLHGRKRKEWLFISHLTLWEGKDLVIWFPFHILLHIYTCTSFISPIVEPRLPFRVWRSLFVSFYNHNSRIVSPPFIYYEFFVCPFLSFFSSCLLDVHSFIRLICWVCFFSTFFSLIQFLFLSLSVITNMFSFSNGYFGIYWLFWVYLD